MARRVISILVTLALTFLMSAVQMPNEARAADNQSTFLLSVKSGVNAGNSLGLLTITHPSFVFCTGTPGTSTACGYTVSIQVTNIASLPLIIDVADGSGGIQGSFTISNSVVNQVYVAASSNMPVYYLVSKNNTAVTGSRVIVQATNLQVTATPNIFKMSGGFGPNTEYSDVRTYSMNSKLTFLQVGFPRAMFSTTTCLSVPIKVGPIDFSTGAGAPAGLRKDIDAEIWITDSSGNDSAIKYLSEAKGTWNTGDSTTSLDFQVCNLDPSDGLENTITLNVRATLRLQGGSNVATSEDDITISGAAPTRKIACAKGTKAIIVTSYSPKCPSGYSKANIPIVNGKLKTTTITCVKGLTARKVTAVIPACPSGYKRK